MKPGGSIANRTGSSLERFIHDTISGEGYVYVENNIFVLYVQEINTVVDGSVKVFTDQLKICKSIYGNNIRCDFMLYNSEKLPHELVIEYSIFMRAGAEEIVSRNYGHGCVNDYERMLCDSVAEEDYYDIAEMNLQCARNGGQWYPHLWNPSQRMKDMGVVMPGRRT